MGQRLIIRGASWPGNAIDSISPSTIYYNVTYSLSNANASVSVSRVAAGSSFSVTITPASGYAISSCSVTHGGLSLAPTGSSYSYYIGSVSGDIVITASATAQAASGSISLSAGTRTRNSIPITVSYSPSSMTQGVSWSITAGSSYASIANGVLTLNSSASGASVTVRAVSTSDPSVEASLTLTNLSYDPTLTILSGDVTWTDGYINVNTNAQVTNNHNYAFTGYISVTGFSSLTSVNHPQHAVAFYDSSKNYLSGWVDDGIQSGVYATEPHTTAIPSGAAFIRCNSVQSTSVSPGGLSSWSLTLTE